MKVVRIYSDSAGETHFDEADVLLTAMASSPVQLSAPAPASQYRFMSLPPEYDFGWHASAGRGLIIFLAGEIEVEVSDGAVCRFRPGDVALAEDTTGKGHDSRSVGTEDAVMVIVGLPG